MPRRYGFRLKRIARADTAQDVAERVKRNATAERVNAEIAARFPVLTAENFTEADAHRKNRTAELLKE